MRKTTARKQENKKTRKHDIDPHPLELQACIGKALSAAGVLHLPYPVHTPYSLLTRNPRELSVKDIAETIVCTNPIITRGRFIVVEAVDGRRRRCTHILPTTAVYIPQTRLDPLRRSQGLITSAKPVT